MVKVYLAGAYSDNNVLGVLKNIGRGQHYAAELFKEGFAPFTPWHDKEFIIHNWQDNFSVKQFYEYSIEWLKVSDALFVVPNHEGLRSYLDSKGTMAEIKFAFDYGIPVFKDIEELKKHFKDEIHGLL